MEGIKTNAKVHQETLEERHAFINKTIEAVMSELKEELTETKSKVTDNKEKLQRFRSRLGSANKQLGDLVKIVNDNMDKTIVDRKILEEALTDHIDTSSNNLNKRIDDLEKEVKLGSLDIEKETNKTEEELSDIKETLSIGIQNIKKVDEKLNNNLFVMDNMAEEMKNDREAVQNITKMYKKLVLVTKIISDNNLTNETNLGEMIADLENTMNLVENNKLKEAFRYYNESVQQLIKNNADDHDQAIDSVKDQIKKVYDGIKRFMYKTLGYVALPQAGMYNIWNHQSMPFNEATEQCAQLLGYIVEYQNETEEANLLKYLSNKYEDDFSFWIGAHDKVNEDTFVWEHSGQELTHFSWYDGEPNNAGMGEDCVEQTNFEKWNDIDCDEYKMFICEFDTKYDIDLLEF